MDVESFQESENWGSINDTTSSDPAWNTDILTNVEEEVILNSIENISFKKYFCDQEHLSYKAMKNETNQTTDSNILKVDDPMKYTVKLMKYKNDFKTIVENSNTNHGFPTWDEQLLLLSQPRCLKEETSNSDHLQFFKHHDSDFVNGISSERLLNITPDSVLHVLRSSITTILAFVGFHETTILPLQVLTEVAESYIKIMLKLLRSNVEKEKLYGEVGFCDVLDRTFHEMGIGSVRNLISYYRNDVINEKNKKTKECQNEITICEDAVQKMRTENQTFSLLRLSDIDNDTLGIPELHVTSLCGNDFLSESFETGLQMLHTLEQQQMNTSTSSETSISTELASVKNEFQEMRYLKRKRK